MIASEFDKLRRMFDVIVVEVKKYSPNTRKLKAKARKCVEYHDMITTAQVKPRRVAVKHAVSFDLQRSIHVKLKRKLGRPSAKHVKLCRDLPSSSKKLPSLREELPSLEKNFLALQKTC